MLDASCHYCGDPVEPPDRTGLTRADRERDACAIIATGVPACRAHADLARTDPAHLRPAAGGGTPWELRLVEPTS